MRVVCKCNMLEPDLTIGQTYTVLDTVSGIPDETKLDYIIENDKGIVDRFISELFYKLDNTINITLTD